MVLSNKNPLFFHAQHTVDEAETVKLLKKLPQDIVEGGAACHWCILTKILMKEKPQYYCG